MAAIPIGKITADTTTQARVAINMEVVEEYAAAIKAGAKLPPIVVFFDGDSHFLADGFHRLHAYRNLGYNAVECTVHNGTREDAILHAVHANDQHGLRRTNADKRRAIELLLTIPGWLNRSARDIAEQCGVYHQLAESVKKAVIEHRDTQVDESSTSVIGKDGKRQPRAKRKARASRGSRSVQQPTAVERDALADVKASFKTIANLNVDAIVERFGRNKLGPHFDAAIAVLNRLCAAFSVDRIELVGVTDVPEKLNRGAWGRWLAYRKESKFKAYKPRSAKENMQWLAEHPSDKQEEIVNLSIRNGYQGLFDQRDSRGTDRGSGKPRLSAVERVERATGGRAF